MIPTYFGTSSPYSRRPNSPRDERRSALREIAGSQHHQSDVPRSRWTSNPRIHLARDEELSPLAPSREILSIHIHTRERSGFAKWYDGSSRVIPLRTSTSRHIPLRSKSPRCLPGLHSRTRPQSRDVLRDIAGYGERPFAPHPRTSALFPSDLGPSPETSDTTSPTSHVYTL